MKIYENAILRGAKVRPETREWIIEGVERSFQWAGATDYASGVASFKKFVEWMQRAHETLQSKEHFSRVLDDVPEPTWMEKRVFQGFFRYAPQILLYSAKSIARTAEESIPELPRGRPGADAYTKAQIVAEISKKELRGCTHKQAKIRTARQFSVSLATVQRAWDDRGNRDEVDFRSVLKFLSAEEDLPAGPSQKAEA